MGGSISVPLKDISISNSIIDYNNGIKKETTIKNGICSEYNYKLDLDTKNWILMNEETLTINMNNNYSDFYMNSDQLNNLLSSNNDITKLDGPEIKIKKENIPKTIYELDTKLKEYKFDYEKIDLVKKYQENTGCINLDETHKLTSLFNSDIAKVKYYESVVKCLVKKL